MGLFFGLYDFNCSILLSSLTFRFLATLGGQLPCDKLLPELLPLRVHVDQHPLHLHQLLNIGEHNDRNSTELFVRPKPHNNNLGIPHFHCLLFPLFMVYLKSAPLSNSQEYFSISPRLGFIFLQLPEQFFYLKLLFS